ncbi:MAG TPA: radical SAM protein [bacterium]|nr:radical SAM protein [bacterium]
MRLIDTNVTCLSQDGSHLYFNPASGGYFVTDARGASLIEFMKAIDDEDEVIEKVARDLGLDVVAAAARYVAFSERLRTRGMLERCPSSDGPPAPPFFGFIEVTRKCPTLCRICAIDTGRGSDDVLSLAELRDVVDQMKDIGIKYVALTGGDPLMRPDLVEILASINAKDLGAGFSTSLLNLREDVASAIGQAGVQVQVSLDGSTAAINDYNRGQGSFDKAIKGIALLNKHKVDFRIACCIMKHNIDDIPAMVKLGEQVGAKEVAFRKIKLLGRALELRREVYPTPAEMARAYSLLYRQTYGRDPGATRINSKYTEVLFGGRGSQFDRLPCGAGRNIIHITYRGDIVPCSLFTEDKFVQGNVRRDRIADVWNTSPLLAFFRNAKTDDIPKCKGCKYKYLCGGGCRAEAYFLEGDLMGECCDCQDLLVYYDHLFGYTAKTEKPITV